MSINSVSGIWAGLNVLRLLTAQAQDVETPQTTNGPWRPPQWGGLPSDQEQLVYVKSNIGGYFFDAIIREEHTSTIRKTEHPVQTGANITDHAYNLPAQLVMEIGMSDVMDSLVPGQYSDGPTKSISAYQTLLKLQHARLPLEVLTRLNYYQNMLIEEINAPDDYKTQFGLRCIIRFGEIFVVEVAKTTVSARPQASSQTQKGTVQATEPPPTVLRQIEDATTGTAESPAIDEPGG